MYLAKCSIERVTAQAFAKKGPIFAKLMSGWQTLLPKDLSSRCFPHKISSYLEQERQITTLHVYLEDSYCGVFLTYNAHIIIERISVYLGGKIINKISSKILGNIPTIKDALCDGQ
jgi:hypothetical protein